MVESTAKQLPGKIVLVWITRSIVGRCSCFFTRMLQVRAIARKQEISPRKRVFARHYSHAVSEIVKAKWERPTLREAQSLSMRADFELLVGDITKS